MSARGRLARTSFTPENEGLPRFTIMPRAALVSASSRFTVAASVEGETASARSFAASLTACAREHGEYRRQLQRRGGFFVLCHFDFLTFL